MLYLVPTPIGNLRDITLRAVEVLKACDGVLCEDTRRTGKLLAAHGISGRLWSFHEHSGAKRAAEILESLEAGKTLALVSDGGMPLVSDPGFELVRECVRQGIRVEALPGPSAFVTALAASGLATDAFGFFGFLPPKRTARQKALRALVDHGETLIFYESPYRLVKALEDMKAVLGDREAVVARELTKKFEEYTRGRLSELAEAFSKKKILGEIVILVSGKGRKKVLTS